MIGTLTGELAARGLTLSTHFQAPSGASLGEVAQRLDASAVVAMTPLPTTQVELLVRGGIRVLGSLSEPGTPAGGLQHAVGATQVRHLHDLGHRRIAFAGTDQAGLEPFRSGREAGVRDAAREIGLPEPVSGTFASDGTDAAAIIEDWHRRGVSAVAAYNDDVALVVLHGIRTAGLSCPGDMAVIGMDGERSGLVSAPPLTTIKPDLSALAAFTSSVVLAELDRDEGEALPLSEVSDRLPVVRRGST
jgi:DNA-binding LacI/PurR family transcriptional regulator